MRGPHCLSLVHATQRCASHAPVPANEMQSFDSQQVPLTHRPAQHTDPEPQSLSAWQAVHCRLVHSCPDGQSAAVQQLPWVHRPPQHTDPVPHCAEVVHAWQVFDWHTRGAQSALPQQSPGRQPPPQH